MPKKYVVLLKILFILVIAYVIWRNIDVVELVRLLGQIYIPMFLLTFLVCLADQACMGLKWNLLLRAFGIQLPASVPVLIYIRGRVIHMVTPSVLGIDAYKAWCIRQTGAPLVATLSSIFVERFVGVISSLAAISITAYFSFSYLQLPNPWIGAVIGSLAFVGLGFGLALSLRYAHTLKRIRFPSLLPEKWRRRLHEWFLSLSLIGNTRSNVWTYYGFSIIEKLFYGSAIYLAARTVGLEGVSFAGIVATTPFLALLERIPISISAIGVREGLIVLLFRPVTADPTIGITIALVLRLAELAVVLVSFGLWLITPKSAKGPRQGPLQREADNGLNQSGD